MITVFLKPLFKPLSHFKQGNQNVACEGEKGIKSNYKGEHLSLKNVLCTSKHTIVSSRKKKSRTRYRNNNLSSYFSVLQYFSYVKFTNAEKHLYKLVILYKRPALY